MTRLDQVDRRGQVAARRHAVFLRRRPRPELCARRQRLSQRLRRTAITRIRPSASSGPFGRRPAGANDLLIQTRINADMGAPARRLAQDTAATRPSDAHRCGRRRRSCAACTTSSPPASAGTRRSTSARFSRRRPRPRPSRSATTRRRRRLVISSITPSSGAIRASQTCVALDRREPPRCTVTVTFDPPSAGSCQHALHRSTTSNCPCRLRPASAPSAAARPSPRPASSAARRPSPSSAAISPLQTDSGVVTITNPVSATANLILSAFNFSRTEFTRTGGTCVTGVRRHRSGRQLHGDGDLHAVRGRSSKRFADHPAQRTVEPGLRDAERHRHAVADQPDRGDGGVRQRAAGQQPAPDARRRQHRARRRSTSPRRCRTLRPR